MRRLILRLVRVSEHTHLSVSSRHHPSDRPVRRLAQPMARAGGRWEDANRSGWPSGEARSRILFYARGAACWQPQLKGLTMMVSSIYNYGRFEDLWLDK